MPGIHFDYTVNDSPFYASADRIVRRVSDMSNTINQVGKNVSFAPLLSNLEKLMKDISLDATAFEGIRSKMTAALTDILNSSDSAEKKQQKLKDAIVDAFTTMSSSVDSELGASKTVLRNFYAELDVVLENLNKKSSDVIDVDAIREKAKDASETFSEWTKPEARAYYGSNPETGSSEIRYEEVDEAVRTIREKALEDVRAVNEELQTLVANLGNGSVEQVQNTLQSLEPLEQQLFAIYEEAKNRQSNVEYGSDEWKEAAEQASIYQKALDQVRSVQEAISAELPESVDVEALNQQKAELEEAIELEEAAVEKLEASKTAIHEAIDATKELSQAEASGSAVASGTPQVYMTQGDYENVKRMREEVANLQLQISQFEGSEEDLTALKEKLSEINDKLRDSEMAAIQTAAAYGDKLGTKASAVSENLYELNDAVDEHEKKVKKLEDELNKAAANVTALDGSDDTDARQKAINEYEQVAQALHQAKAEHANLKVEQHEAKNAWIETTAEMERHDSVLVKLLGGEEKFKEITSNLPGPLGEAINGLTGMTGAAKAFIATPLGVVLAALILAWQALNSWFERSEEGQMALAQITGYLSGIMETLKDVVASVGEVIYKAFTNPKKAMQNFGSFLWSQVVNRFKALGLIAESVAGILKNLFEGNWGGVVKSAKDMANAWAQLGTGIEKPISKAVNALDNLNKKAKESAKISVDEKQLQREEAKTKRLVAEYDARAKQLEAKGKRRTAAENKELKTIQNRIFNAEKSIIDKKIKLQERAMDNGKYDTIEDQNKLDSLYAERERLLGKQKAKQERLRSSEIASANKLAKELANRNSKQLQDQWKHEQEMTALAQKAQEARTEANIAAIRNDSEREKAEREAQHQRNIQDINNQTTDIYKAIYEMRKKAYELANKDKKYESTSEGQAGYLSSDAQESMRSSFNEEEQEYYDLRIQVQKAALEKENAEYLRMVEQRYDAERQATLDFLKEYGDYEQQKLAITKDYESKIADASSVTEKASLGMQMDKTLKDLEKKKLEDSIDWAGVFNDLSGHTEEYLVGLRDQLQNILSTGNLPIDQMETIQGKIREINDAINEQGGMFSFANEQQREHTRRVQEAADAQNRLNQALKEQTELENQVAELEISIRDSLRSIDPELAGIDFDEGWLDALGLDKQSDLYKKLSEQAVKLAKAEGMLSGAREKTSKTWGGWKKAEDGAKESLEDSIARVAGNIKDWCNNYLGDLPDLLNEIGLSSAGEKVSQGLSAVNNVAGAAADYASGNYVGAALKAVSAVKDFGRVLGIGGGNAAEINKQLARLSERNEILTQSIDKLTQVMSGKSGASAIKEYEKVADMQKELEDNLKKQMQLQMQYHSAHGSFNSYWGSGFSAAEIAEFNKRHGTNWSGNLNDLNADLASLLMGEADMWQKINDTGKGGYGGRVAEKIKELAEQAGKAKEQTDALYESLTAGTSRNSVFDDFLNSLYDLADGSEEVFENIEKNWQQMVNHMVINNLIGAKMQQDLEKWYEELAELNRQRTKEGSTMTDDFYKSELKRLQDDYTSLVESGQQQIEQFREMGIIKSVQEEANDAAEATKGYLDTIRSSFEELVSGSEVDIEQWGKNLRNSILQNLVQSRLLDEAFETWAEEWGRKYTDLISQMADGAITQTDYDAQLTTLMDEFDKTTDGISEKSKAMWEAFGFSAEEAAEQTESAFKDLHSSFLSTLTDLNADVEAWSKNITKTMVEQLVERNILNDAFDQQMDEWRSRFENALSTGDTEGLKALRTELDELRGSLAEQAAAYMDALGYVEDAVSDTTFKDMSGDFKSSLMNLDSTAEDWAESVGRKMAEKMIEQMVSSTMIQPYLDQLQEAFNNAMSVEGTTIDNVLGLLAPQIDAAKQAFNDAQPVAQRIMEAFGITRKEDKELPFSDLRSTFVNTLMDMESDAEKFGKEISKTLIEQMVDKTLKDQFQDKLDDLNNQWAEALENGDSTAITRIREQMVDLRERAKDAVQPLIDDLKALEIELEDTPLHGLRSTFLSDLMSMENDTQAFAENINKILTEAFIDKFVLGDAFDEQLENWEKRYGDIMGADISEEERARQLKALQETITAARDDYAEQARAIQDFMGTSQYGDQQAAVNMADKATYDQFEMYLGIATAQQIALEQGNDVRRQILATLQAMSGITTPGSNIGAEISGKLNITNEYLLTIRNYCATITETFAQKLDYIGNKLARF